MLDLAFLHRHQGGAGGLTKSSRSKLNAMRGQGPYKSNENRSIDRYAQFKSLYFFPWIRIRSWLSAGQQYQARAASSQARQSIEKITSGQPLGPFVPDLEFRRDALPRLGNNIDYVVHVIVDTEAQNTHRKRPLVDRSFVVV